MFVEAEEKVTRAASNAATAAATDMASRSASEYVSTSQSNARDLFDAKSTKQLKLSAAFYVIPPLIMLLNTILQTNNVDVCAALGIRVRKVRGLVGVIFAPWAHFTWTHYSANLVGWLGLAFGMLTYGLKASCLAFTWITLLGGFAVWGAAIDSNSLHAGASGVLFGFLGFLLSAVCWERPVRVLSVVVLVVAFLLYGSLIAVFFSKEGYEGGVSWESHLYGLLAGLLFAWLYFKKMKTLAPPRAAKQTLVDHDRTGTVVNGGGLGGIGSLPSSSATFGASNGIGGPTWDASQAKSGAKSGKSNVNDHFPSFSTAEADDSDSKGWGGGGDFGSPSDTTDIFSDELPEASYPTYGSKGFQV